MARAWNRAIYLFYLFYLFYLYHGAIQAARLTLELTGFYEAQRSKNPVQRFVSCYFGSLNLYATHSL